MKCRRAKPRTWEDRENRADYLSRHPSCQMCGEPTSDPHHILGRGWHGADSDANLLALCRPCHDSVNGTICGKVASLLAKLRAGELDYEGFKNVGYSVTGKLDGVWRDAPGVRSEMVDELLRGGE